MLKSKLDAKNIAYTENNSVEEMLSLGIDKLPVLSIGDTLLEFKDAVDWVNKQKENVE